MGRFARIGWIAGLGALPVLLAGCSSLGGPPPSAAALDLAGVDLASALFAVDMPLSVEAVAEPRVTYGSALDAILVRADAEAVMGVLQPPAEGRSYAVYAFSASDQAKVRGIQAAPTAGGSRLSVQPRLCITPEAQKSADRVSVIAIVPGQRPLSVTGPETLLALEQRSGAALPPCAGHSG